MSDQEMRPSETVSCEGDCEQHVEPIQRYRVWDGAKDWGEFNYCTTAAKHDAKRGFLLEVL